MRLLFVILLASVVLLAVSCTSRSGRRTARSAPTTAVKPHRILQVMYEDGRIENIMDDRRLPFKMGDTIVVRKYAYLEEGKKLYDGDYIYGKYIPGKLPKNHYTDTSYNENYIGVIQRILLP